MSRRASWTYCVVFFLVLVGAPHWAHSADRVSYHLTYDLHEPDSVAVRIDLPGNQPGERVFVMPRSIPMGYASVHYDRFVEEMRAFSAREAALPVRRGQGSRWLLGNAETTVKRIEYKVNVKRMERDLLSAADASKIRANYVGLLGISVFGYVAGLEGHAIKLALRVPDGWPVFTTLAPEAPPVTETMQATATDFYLLADSQIIAGSAAKVMKLTGRVPLFLAMYAEVDADTALLGGLIEETMAQVLTYFGTAPFEHYSVHYELLKPISDRHEYGFSLEHMDSCTIFLDVSRSLTANSSQRDLLRARYNLAHHIAHSWIPKRAGGTGYFPHAWEDVPIIDTIWFSEGFIQYAAVEIITDGLPEDQRKQIRDRIIDQRFGRTLRETPEFLKRMSLIELSRAASTKYSEDFRYGRNVFSRGAMMAKELDQLIREQSGGNKRLRDCLRHIMARNEPKRKPFEVAELPEIFLDAAGADVRGVIDRWMRPPTK